MFVGGGVDVELEGISLTDSFRKVSRFSNSSNSNSRNPENPQMTPFIPSVKCDCTYVSIYAIQGKCNFCSKWTQKLPLTPEKTKNNEIFDLEFLEFLLKRSRFPSISIAAGNFLIFNSPWMPNFNLMIKRHFMRCHKLRPFLKLRCAYDSFFRLCLDTFFTEACLLFPRRIAILIDILTFLEPKEQQKVCDGLPKENKWSFNK